MEGKISITFDQFYEKYYEQVFWYVYKRINHREEAQDLASDVFCICFKHFKEYDPERSSLSTWLYVIVNNKLKNYYRDKKQQVEFDEKLDIYMETEADYILQAVLLEEYRKILAEAISALPEKNQKVILMKYFGGRSSDEIAGVLGISSVNVRVILSRSLKKINGYLVKKGWNGEL